MIYQLCAALFLPRDASVKHGLCCRVVSVCVCMCRCVSVTFVHSVKTNKHIFKISSPLGSPTIHVFPYQTA